MFVRWNLTVCGATQNSFAICVVREPAGESAEDGQLALGEAERLRAGSFLVHADRGVDVPFERLPERRR